MAEGRRRARVIRVGVDARVLSAQVQRAGVAQYIAEILRDGEDVSDVAVTALSYEQEQCRVGKVPIDVIRLVPGVPWQSVLLPSHLVRKRFDVVHGPAFSIPPSFWVKRVVTVHDVAFMRMPHTVRADTVHYLQRVVKYAVHHAAAIIVPSHEVETDLVKLWPKTASRIRVIPLGADRLAHVSPTSGYRLDAPYFLHIGTIEPRKNLTFLLEAFAYAVKDGHLPHHLVLAGARGWNNEDFWEALRQSPVANRVHVLGYVDDSQSVQLYQDAAVYVQPSHYEGFGLGALEALWFGVPTVASPTGAVRDVHVAGLQVVETRDVAVWAHAMQQATSLSRAGVRDALPTWRETRRLHYALYREVAQT